MAGAKDRLRKLLNPSIKGPMTDALLEALAVGDDLNDFNIQAVHDQLYLSSASGRYLDKATGSIGFIRPLNIGLGDDAYRELAITTTARKQITSILLDVLEVFYGPEAVRASMVSVGMEPYNLNDGDQLIIQNEKGTIILTFQSSEFSNIAQATAQEVAASITRQLRDLRTSEAELKSFAVDFFDADSQDTGIQLVSGVKGTTSELKILGGAAQNELKFPTQLNTFQSPGTKWLVQKQAGATLKFTWNNTTPAIAISTISRVSGVVTLTTGAAHGFILGQNVTIVGVTDLSFDGNVTITSVPGGTSFTYSQSTLPDAGPFVTGTAVAASPNLGILAEDDIANIYGDAFDVDNQGAWKITEVVDGIAGLAYFEVFNELGVPETVTQANTSDVSFLRPTRTTILSDQRYATVFEVAANVIQVFLPATTQVIERQLEGAAHIQTNAAAQDFLGPYIYDPSKGGVLTENTTTLTTAIQAGRTQRVIDVQAATDFPDEEGYLVFGFGTDKEEIPVKYIGRPGSQILLVDPAHLFQYDHPIGTDITLLSSREPPAPKVNGEDVAFYLTGTANGRIFAEELIEKLVATGLTLVITIIYPGSVGLGNFDKPTTGDPPLSDVVYIWSGDDT